MRVPDGENAPPEEPTKRCGPVGEIVARLLAGEVIESPILERFSETRNVAVHVVLRAKGVRLADCLKAARCG